MAESYSPCPQCAQVNRVRFGNHESKKAVCGHCNAPLIFESGVSDVSPSGFAAILAKSPLPVVVDFWAPWCGPCRMFAPTFRSVASRYSDRMVFVKVNTENHESLAAKHKIQSIPTLIVFNHNEELTRLPGFLPEPKFEHWLNLSLQKVRKTA